MHKQSNIKKIFPQNNIHVMENATQQTQTNTQMTSVWQITITMYHTMSDNSAYQYKINSKMHALLFLKALSLYNGTVNGNSHH